VVCDSYKLHLALVGVVAGGVAASVVSRALLDVICRGALLAWTDLLFMEDLLVKGLEGRDASADDVEEDFRRAPRKEGDRSPCNILADGQFLRLGSFDGPKDTRTVIS
jgi:hypothetical protein